MMMDHLHFKQLHFLGLLKLKPLLPKVCCSLQKEKFESTVKNYFDASKIILG